jgi:hypothetical protein
MGWSSGSRLFSEMIEVLMNNVSESDVRAAVYDEFIDLFEYHDCDTLSECTGVDGVFDKVWLDRNPEEELEEELEDEDWDNQDRETF